MEIKRIEKRHVCQIHEYDFIDKKAAYITFSKIAETGMVNHIFSTRLGGVSEGIFSEMNLSFTRGDNKDHVFENFRRIAEIMGCEPSDIVCSDQTHTTNIRVVTKLDKGKGVTTERDYTDIDGLITNEPGICLATFYADCVPLYLVDPVHHAIGLSHSGWRGTVHRMGKATLDAMQKEYQTNPKDVIAAIGPSICQSCYEVSGDVAQEFINEFGELGKELLYPTVPNKYQLNLHYANKQVLLQAGVLEENIQITDLCTCCNGNFLFSHRKSEGKRGNLGAFMMLK